MKVGHAVILAGGRSRRMGGGDKFLLPLGARSLLGHVIERLAPQAGQLALNANSTSETLAEFDLPVLPDSVANHPGPLAGVLAAMDWAAGQGASHVATVAADTPFFPADTVARLHAALCDTQPVAMAATRHPDRGLLRHPTFAVWPVSARDRLREALASGTRKVVMFSDALGCAWVEFPVGRVDPFFNVNTPEDLARARAALQGACA